MAIRVEFFGIARQRAGIGEISITPPQGHWALGNVLERVAGEIPQLRGLIEGGRLDASLAANLDGDRFVNDPETEILDGQCLLVLSADAGG